MASKPDNDAPQETSNSKQPKPYGSVIISLENCLLSDDRLSKTPSSEDGLDPEAEFDLRLVGCELIQSAGILLRLPQVAMATGQVLFQRFYYSKSFVRHPMEVTAMGCVCLASKVEEAPRRIRDVVSIFHHLRQLRVGKPIQPMLLDQTYINLKNQVIKAERRVLKELGFCVHVKHPHKIVVVYLQLLGLERNKKLAQMSWNYMNDSLRTDVWVRYSPETIASACIFLSAKILGIPLPTQPAWYLVFGAQETDLKLIAIRLIQLYKRPKPDTELLEKTISTLQEAYQEARQKRLGIVAESHSSGQSPVCSRPVSPSKNNAAENKESITNGVETKEADDEKSPKLSSKSRSEEKRREKHLSKSLSRSRSRSPSVEVEREKRHRKHRKRRTRSRSRSPVRSRDRKEKDREKEDRHSSRSSLTKRSHKYDREERYKEKERDRDREKLDRYSSKEERYYERDKDRHRSKSDKEKDRRR